MSDIIPAETDASGGVISYIPLTTTFTAPSSCSSVFRLDGPSLMAYDPGYGLDINTNVICGPQAVTSWWEQARLGVVVSGHTEIRLGPLTCPYPFTTAATSVKDTSSTSVFCCPSGYDLRDSTPGEANGDCLSDVSSGQVLTYASTPATASTQWSIMTTTLSGSSTVGAIAVAGWNVKQASTASSSSTTSLALTTSLSPSSSSSPSSPSQNSDLSSGAKAGIGVGVAIGVIVLLMFVGVIIFLKRRKSRMNAAVQAGPEPKEVIPYDTRNDRHMDPAELPSVTRPTELPSQRSQREPHELE